MRQNTNQHQPLPLFTASICSLIQLDRSSDTPLYQQISDKIREAILSGQLAGDGLVEGHVGRGTLVKRSQFNYLDDNYDANGPSWLFGLPTTEREILGPDARMLSELASVGDDIISLAAGTPAIELLPAEMLNAIFAEGLVRARQSALGYCPVEGLLSLRRDIAMHMRNRGVAVDAQHILILSGSTQGIGLVGRFLLNPGDEVVVEVPTYLGAIQ